MLKSEFSKLSLSTVTRSGEKCWFFAKIIDTNNLITFQGWLRDVLSQKTKGFENFSVFPI